jgi:O-antigen/teichoic acid export membrane protein
MWLVELVVIITGFVTPRLIDEQLGQVQLGVWDLGWSIVSYFRFLGMGMTGGLNRFVALYQASGEHEKLGRIVSSTIMLQVFWAVLMVLFATGAAYFVPIIVDDQHSEVVEPVRWVVIFLGGTLAARTFGSSARGLLTGYHMWTLNSAVQITGDIGSLAAMIWVLLSGGGLRELAGIYFLITVCTESIRFVIARRCYQRKLFDSSEVAFEEVKSLFVFSLKTNAGALPPIIVIQTLNIALATVAGPAALAVYARTLALQRHASVLISSFTKLLTPTMGSMQGLGQESAYKPFFLLSMRMSLALTLPLYIALVVVGDLLLLLWMGEDYIAPGLVLLVCAGMLLPTVFTAALRMLAGLNEHGKAGVISLAFTLVLLGTGLVVVAINDIVWSAYVAGALLGICLTFGSAIPITVLAMRRFNVSTWEMLSVVVAPPLLANAPFAVFLVAGMQRIDQTSPIQLITLLLAAGAIWLVSCWYLLLTREDKKRILKKLGRR